eukprot:12817263-Heterocapsa_arctica.AAC.1
MEPFRQQIAQDKQLKIVVCIEVQAGRVSPESEEDNAKPSEYYCVLMSGTRKGSILRRTGVRDSVNAHQNISGADGHGLSHMQHSCL